MLDDIGNIVMFSGLISLTGLAVAPGFGQTQATSSVHIIMTPIMKKYLLDIVPNRLLCN
jgi:hypothetical protein